MGCAGELQVRTYLALSAAAGTTAADLDRLEDVRKQVGDDPTLKTGAFKIHADGVIESRRGAAGALYQQPRGGLAEPVGRRDEPPGVDG